MNRCPRQFLINWPSLRHTHFIDYDEVADWLSSRVLHLYQHTFFLQLLYNNICLQFGDIFMCDVAYLAPDNHTPPWSEDHTNGKAEWVVLSCYFVSGGVSLAISSVVLSSDISLSSSCLRTLLVLPVEIVMSSCIFPSYAIGISLSGVAMWLLVVSTPHTERTSFTWNGTHPQGLNEGYRLS